MKKKIISAVLALSIIMTSFIAANVTTTAVTTDKSSTSAPATFSDITANPYGMADSIDDSTILQAWNWSYNNIAAELYKIGEQGFTTIQISPPNEIKLGTKDIPVSGSSDNGWWMFYQPVGFQINESTDNALGTKADLVAMVMAAHAKGIKVIADTVINHVASNGNEDGSVTDPILHVADKVQTFEPTIYNNKLFHDPWFNMTYAYEWSGPESTCTYDLTRGCTSNLPDLKTEDLRVQSAIYKYLQELVDCGIDGFRIDAAKHIETPSDSASFRSDFLTNTISKAKTYAKNTYGKELLSYGEILNTCGYGRSYQFYTPFMKVTDSTTYRAVQDNVDGGSAAGALPVNMANDNSTKAQVVLWNESHDTYMDGATKDFSTIKRNKSWAAIAARDGITSMYLARPNSLSQKLGVASETDWTAKEVSEVNKFSNIYSGQGEYLSNGNNVAVIGRGTSSANGGAVLINCNQGGSRSVSGLSVPTLANGTYTDHISGSTFTVSGGKVSGSIGSTGIAVLYSNNPAVGGTDSKYYTGNSVTVSFTARNVDRATYSVNGSAEVEYTTGSKFTFGTAADTQGATYKVVLKGYVGGTEKATATYEYTKIDPETEYTVTFNTNGVSGWLGTPYMHYWNGSTSAGSTWPGVKMTGSGGTYTATVSNAYDHVLFTMSASGPQTIDMPISCSSEFSLQSSSIMDGETKKYNVTSTPRISVDKYYPRMDNPPQPTTQAPTTAAPTQPTSFQSDYAYGDVDRNGTIDINDVTVIQMRLAMLITIDKEQQHLADFNRDSRVSIQDATAIQYYLLTKV